jgi:tetratricopeptide (TPR) repeat protein
VLNGDFETAQRRTEEALSLAESLQDAWDIAHARFLLGFAAAEKGDFDAARWPLEESLRLFRELGDENFLGIVTYNLSWTYDELGEFEQAHRLNEENLRRAETLGDERLRFFALSSLSGDAEREGRLPDAVALLQESIRVALAQDDPAHTAFMLPRLALLIATAGEGEVAAKLLAYATKRQQDLGVDPPPYVAKPTDETMALLRTQLNESVLTALFEQGRTLSADAALDLALQHRSFAE